MDAREVKDSLRRRHPAVVEGQPGPWTTIEEWMNIDLLAVASWSSVKPYPSHARVGYEVKVSRADFRRELARPGKRARAVTFCHEFYFAVPRGLLKPAEITWAPPERFAESGPPFEPMRCPGAYGAYCHDGRATFGRGPLRSRFGNTRYFGRADWVDERARRDAIRDTYAHVYSAECPTCRGTGSLAPSPAVRAGAPHLWVPDDVGLVQIREDGVATIVKKAPRRNPRQSPPWEAGLGDKELADLIRWVSVRPDPRHTELRAART